MHLILRYRGYMVCLKKVIVGRTFTLHITFLTSLFHCDFCLFQRTACFHLYHHGVKSPGTDLWLDLWLVTLQRVSEHLISTCGYLVQMVLSNSNKRIYDVKCGSSLGLTASGGNWQNKENNWQQAAALGGETHFTGGIGINTGTVCHSLTVWARKLLDASGLSGGIFEVLSTCMK